MWPSLKTAALWTAIVASVGATAFLAASRFHLAPQFGQKIGGQETPLYVVRIEPDARRVVVGPKAALAVASATLSGINRLAPGFNGPCAAKVRSMAKPVPARLEGERLLFASPEYGVAPGQAAVLYDGDRVLGGGWIEATQETALAA